MPNTSMKGNGPVSVIIPAFNSSRTLVHTLPSVLRQNRSLIADIVVVDSSDDGLMDPLVSEYGPLGVRFVRSGTRVMPAIQRNIGARESSGEILLFLDSDVILEDGYLEKIVESYRQGRLAGFGGVTLPGFQSREAIAVAQYYFQLNEYLPVGEPRTKDLILGCNNFVSRGLFEKAGGYPEIRAAEDVLYGKKLSELCPIWFLPHATVAHIFRMDRPGYARNQEMLGKYVAVYRKDPRPPKSFIGILPVLLFPAFAAVKAARIFARVAMAGPGHLRRCLSVLPYFNLGLWHWTRGFVKEAMAKSP